MDEKTVPTKLDDEILKNVVGGNGSVPSAPCGDNTVVQRALQEVGKPYAWGAIGPDAYDASGLVSYCLTGQHTRIGTESTFMSWTRVSEPMPGDICVSNSHCGIYIGQNSMIHAPCFGAAVSTGSISPDMIIVRR